MGILNCLSGDSSELFETRFTLKRFHTVCVAWLPLNKAVKPNYLTGLAPLILILRYENVAI